MQKLAMSQDGLESTFTHKYHPMCFYGSVSLILILLSLQEGINILLDSGYKIRLINTL